MDYISVIGFALSSLCDVHHATTETLHSTALPSRCTPAGVLPNMLSGGHVVLSCSDSASNASPQSTLSRHDAGPASAGEGPSVKGFRLESSSDFLLEILFPNAGGAEHTRRGHQGSGRAALVCGSACSHHQRPRPHDRRQCALHTLHPCRG